MEKYIPVLKRTRLFAGVAEQEIEAMLGCLNASARCWRKGETIAHQGEYAGGLMVLVSGLVHIQQDDYWGNRSIVHAITPGGMFGESYLSPGSGPMLSDVVAVEDSVVIFFDVSRLLSVCSSACRFHSLTVKNLFFALSEKNRQLVNRLSIATQRTIRDKLIAYLSAEAGRHGSPAFEIPFNRQQLADYLSADRSALSAELGRMRNEGLLRFEKNRFELLDKRITP